MLFKTFSNRNTLVSLLMSAMHQYRAAAVRLRFLTKTVRVMKLMAVWMLVFCVHVAAKGRAQHITFSGKNIRLEKAFREIEKQTGYVVFSGKDLLKDAKPVTISAQRMPLHEFLRTILKDQQLDYSVEEQTIFIRKKKVVVIPAPAAERIPVRGIITDSVGGRLAGATVMIKGSAVSVVSDNTGQFAIEANEGDILVISYIGYKSREFKVANGQPLAITLFIENTAMAEVSINVNTGYQSISRERAPGSYSIISAKKFENKLRPDLRAALEGQAAGLIMTREGNIEIRGVSTFATANEKAPLIIVDGYPISGGLETINTDNVESVTILKDAVAASIYGARSSNGVIVITTKQGRKGAVNVEYRGSTGIVLKPDLSYLNRASTADFIDAEIDLYNQDPNGRLLSYNNYGFISNVNYLLVAKSQGWIPAAEADKQIEQLKQNDGLGQVEKYLFRNQVTQQHNIALTAGGDKSLLSAAVKFIDNRANALYTGDNRLILDLRNDWKPNKRITVKLLSNVNYSTSEAPVRPLTDFMNHYSNTYIQPYNLFVDPETGQTQDIFAVNPKKLDRYSTIPGLKPMNYNPIADLGMETTKTQNLQLRVGGSINVVITDGLNIEAGGSWTRGNLFSRSLYSKNSFRMRLWYNDNTSVSNTAKHYLPDGDMINESRNVNESYTLRAQLNYSKTFGKHSVTAIGGAELNRDIFDNNSFPTRFGYNDQAGTFGTFNYTDYNAGLYNADMLGTSKPTASLGTISFRDNRFASWYANGLYEFDRRFMVSGSIRLDQTNFFGTDPKYRYKPLWSAGGTYKLSNEQFFDVSWLNKLYLRGSYGINGNISLNTGPFLIIAPGSFSNLTGDVSYSISSPPNKSLRWEKTNTINLGTDVSFLRSRLNMTIDYYLRKSKDLLASDAVDPTLGYSSLTKNVGRINNTGIELTLEGDIVRNSGFVWNAFGTVSYNKNRVIDYNVNYTSASSLTLTSATREGYPMNAVFSYRFAGLDNNGSPLAYDKTNTVITPGNAKIDDVALSGTLRPKFVYSLTNTFRYRNFELAFLLMAKTGHVIRRSVYDGTNINSKDVGKRWRNPGDEKNGVIFPKLSATSLTSFYFPYSDIFVESGNFLKCRDASLTYNFNKDLFRKIGVSAASITLNARNLFMIAANSDGLDPEAWELGAADTRQAELGFTYLPPRLEFYVGLRVNF